MRTARSAALLAAVVLAALSLSADAQLPYAGLWAGVRTMEIGSDDIRFQYTVTDGKYSGVMLHPGGGRAVQKNLTQTADGLTWESPNNGGGTWVYRVRLAGPDSMVGTLVLRDAPANLRPAPQGTLVLQRQPSEKHRP
jgi:hypothetical protein